MTNIRIILVLLAGTLMLFLALRLQGTALVQPYAPAGIVSLEFASDSKQIESMIDGWRKDVLTPILVKNILIDFLFIPFYSLLFYTLTGTISVKIKGIAAQLGVILAFLSLIAGTLDVLENVLMLAAAQGYYSDLSGMMTHFFAGGKFLFLGLGLLYLMIMGQYLAFKRPAR